FIQQCQVDRIGHEEAIEVVSREIQQHITLRVYIGYAGHSERTVALNAALSTQVEILGIHLEQAKGAGVLNLNSLTRHRYVVAQLVGTLEGDIAIVSRCAEYIGRQ